MSELFPLTEGRFTSNTVPMTKGASSPALFASEIVRVFIIFCRDLAGLAQGRDPADWGGFKERERIWALWASRQRLYLWVHLIAFVLIIFMYFMVLTCYFVPFFFFLHRSRHLAWICPVFYWWHGVARWHGQGEVYFWESDNSCGTSHDQGADAVGGLQRIWERNFVHSAGLCFHQLEKSSQLPEMYSVFINVNIWIPKKDARRLCPVKKIIALINII